jgi:hypothetical protein
MRHILEPFLQKKGQKPINVNKQASAQCVVVVISSLSFFFCKSQQNMNGKICGSENFLGVLFLPEDGGFYFGIINAMQFCWLLA